MFDYAKISKMIEYKEKGKWPLKKSGIAAKLGMRKKKTFDGFIKSKIKNYLSIPTDSHFYHKNIFRSGTRGWEYPWVLEQLDDVKEGATLLDCGCGSSDFILQYYDRGLKPIGFDYIRSADHPNSELTKQHIDSLKGHVNFINGGMHDIPLEDNSIDVVTCISVMEHVVIEQKNEPEYHYQCLAEIKRVLRPGGLLICTYDTVLSEKALYEGTMEWGDEGWSYLKDIEYLDMDFKDPSYAPKNISEIFSDEDTFFIPPDLYLEHGYGEGFNLFKPYHRLTSIGFALRK